MRILQINSVCGTGSTGRIAADLYDGLLQRGHECSIAYGRGTAPKTIRTYCINKKADVICHGVLSRLTDRQGFYSSYATKKFITWMKNYNPDIVHLHNIHGYYLNIAVLFEALREMGKPVVWTLHDCWAFTGHCAHFDYIGCDRWKKGCYQCPQKRSYPASFLLDRSRKNYKDKKRLIEGLSNLTLISPSSWLADLVGQSFLKYHRIQVIPNGVDVDLFRERNSEFRKKYNVENKFILLGVASGWNERKGYNSFLQLAKRLDNNSRIVLVGVSKQQKKKLPDYITGIEKTNHAKELAQIYTAADVFLNLTKEDNYPTVNLEAQLCGTPIITYDTGGCRESVCPGSIILKEKSIQAVIKSLKKDRSILEVNRYRFSKERMMEEYLGCYEKLFNETK